MSNDTISSRHIDVWFDSILFFEINFHGLEWSLCDDNHIFMFSKFYAIDLHRKKIGWFWIFGKIVLPLVNLLRFLVLWTACVGVNNHMASNGHFQSISHQHAISDNFSLINMCIWLKSNRCNRMILIFKNYFQWDWASVRTRFVSIKCTH